MVTIGPEYVLKLLTVHSIQLHIMSMIKAWLHEQMEQEIREEEMFFNADKHYEIEQAMREGMDESSTQQEELNESTD